MDYLKKTVINTNVPADVKRDLVVYTADCNGLVNQREVLIYLIKVSLKSTTPETIREFVDATHSDEPKQKTVVAHPAPKVETVEAIKPTKNLFEKL